MLGPAVQVMNEYKILLVKMKIDSKPLAKDDTKKKVPKDKKLIKLAQKTPGFSG